MCKRLMVVILVLGVLFAPAVAFADVVIDDDFNDKIIYGPNIWNIRTGEYVVQCYSASNFNAALTALGYNPYSSVFTDDVKAYLSNSSTGGSFVEFANGFSNNNDGNGDFSVIGASFDSALMLNNQIYGSKYVYSSKYTGDLFQAAKTRVEEVLSGNTGGGSGGGTSGNTYTMPIWCDRSRNQQNGYNGNRVYTISGVDYFTFTNYEQYQIAEPVSITVNDEIQSHIQTFLQSGGTTYIFGASQKSSNSYNMYVYHYDNGITVTPYEYTVYKFGVQDTMYGKYVASCNETTGYQYIRFTATFEANTNHLVVDDNQTISVVSSTLSSNRTDNQSPVYFALDISKDGNGGGAPVVPPTQWPEPEPTTPVEPPEVPDPPEPTTPTEPTITVPTIPTLPPLTYPTEPTYPTADIAAILDAMAKHCRHLQECMKNVSDDYYDSMTAYMLTLQNKDFEFFRSWFRVTLDTITDCFHDLTDYLQRLFEWLEDELDFSFTGGNFDDSSIVSWLKKIYSKLGSGTTVRPTDPVVDPKGIGDWFDQLIKNFVLDLLALGQDLLADVVEMFRQLITKFPFSIPWDIAAMLALFAASPQTPVIEVPQYALGAGGITQVGQYRIDLRPYNDAMSLARSVECVVFAFWLAFKIDFFKTVLDGVFGGNK